MIARARPESEAAHLLIGGMDAFACGLKIAARMMRNGALAKFIKQRYANWDKGLGRKIERGAVGFEELEAHTLKYGEPKVQSGRQEMLENILNQYILG